ncbi:hypothetical protein HPB49_018154 [Dermacentor silvarum]|uniref:Uncharacterized protein n=1 Tax=Dermacentor silvarum TaxID=543639 RepID=A0ACB8DEP5_DERSI|nr:hypothetical protein HPB49_018154 [Dermacentor silvarum]
MLYSASYKSLLAFESGLPLLVFLLLLSDAVHRCEAQQPQTQQVTTNYGVVTGSLMQAPAPGLVTQVPVYAFQGIRYAKPPVGRRRFERPEPLDQRSSFSDNLQVSPRCLQWTSFPSERIVGDEDCLYLDIYVPATYFATPVTKLPVVVFIPGPDFKSGGKDEIKPGYDFGSRNIFVVVNYRLGVFGFLSTEDENGKGNMGLWDQQMALRFVKSNIAAFGGIPEKVTLMGFGAGAMSVSFHMLNAASSALFSRAIMSGGSAASPEATITNPWRNARQLGRAVGCGQEDGASLIACLRTIDAVKLVEKAHYEQMLTDFLVGAPIEMALSGHLRLLQGTSYTSPNPAFLYIFGIPNAPRTFANLQKGSRELYVGSACNRHRNAKRYQVQQTPSPPRNNPQREGADGATYMDDMLYTVNTEGLVLTTDTVRDPLIVGYMTTFFMAFINGQDPGGILRPINPTLRQYTNMSLTYPGGLSDSVPYRPQEMDFWNYFVPDLHLELNRTSWASYHNAREATHFKAATWGTTTLVVLLVLIIVGLLAAFFVYRRQKQREKERLAEFPKFFVRYSQDNTPNAADIFANILNIMITRRCEQL